MSWGFWISFLVLLSCLGLVVARPGRMPIALPVVLGAGAVVATGLEPVARVLGLWGLTWDAVATLVGLMLLSAALDRARFFAWCAAWIRKVSGHRAALLWWGLMLLACVTATILANDGAMLILVPLYSEIARGAGLERKQALAFLIPAGFLIDVASCTFSTSNLTNLMVADYFHLGFLTYARLMILPSLLVVGGALPLLWFVFRRQMPRTLLQDQLAEFAAGRPAPSTPDRAEPGPRALAPERDAAVWHGEAGLVAGPVGVDPVMFVASWAGLAALVAGLAVSHLMAWPVSAVVGVVAISLLALALVRGFVKPQELPRLAPWSIAFFALGMFVLVDSVARNGGTELLVRSWAGGGPWRIGAMLSLLASGLDNLPALLLGLLGFGRLHGASPAAMAASVVAVDVGCKLTPYGSLATLLWLRLLADRGWRVRWRDYLPYGLALTPGLVALGLAGALLAGR